MEARSNFGANAEITLHAKPNVDQAMGVEGYYHITCHDKDGNLKWEEEIPNLVVAVGKQLMFDTFLKGSAYTVTGPYLGLISNSFTAVATDTMASKGWIEFTNYTVGGSSVRGTPVFAAATSTGTSPGNITTSTAGAVTYTITGVGGTIYGCFLVLGPGAALTFNSTAGTLYSEGLFTSAKGTSAGDTVAVTYSTTATS